MNKVKPFKDYYYDISDPNARTSQSVILKSRNIAIGTLLSDLPRAKFPYDRNTGEIKGVKLRTEVLPEVLAANAMEGIGEMPAYGTPEFWSWMRKRKLLKKQQDAATQAVRLVFSRVPGRVLDPAGAAWTQDPLFCATTTAGGTEHEIATEPVVAEAVAAETEVINTNDEVSDDILESSSMPVRGPGRPKKPIDMVQVLHDELQHSRKANDKIADCYEGLLPMLERNQIKIKISPWFKKKIWRAQYGEIVSALCPICSDSTISSESFSTGHIIPESKGGPIAIHNMMAICDDCNSQMGTHHLYWFAWRYYSKVFWQV